jgi:hypothetical protein
MLLKYATYKTHSAYIIIMQVIHYYPTNETHLRKPCIRIYTFLILYNYVPTKHKLRCDDLYTIITKQYFCTNAHYFYFSMNEFLQFWYAMYRRLTSLRHQILPD